jgi:hypothetical protein
MKNLWRYFAVFIFALLISMTFLKKLNAPFEITDFKFLESENGAVRTQTAYKPKDKVYITFGLDGYGLDEQGRPHVLVEITGCDFDGVQLFKPITDEVRQTSKGKKPHGYLNVELPAFAATGKYAITVKARDAVNNADCELVRALDVDGYPTVVSKQLEFRDFGFSSSKDGVPVKHLAVNAGDTIYSYSKVAGMQFREDKIDVLISLQVVGPLGQTIVEKPDLMELKNSYFYRPPGFFGEIYAWIGVPSDARPGKYIWKYKMTDRLANASTDHEEEFEVK